MPNKQLKPFRPFSLPRYTVHHRLRTWFVSLPDEARGLGAPQSDVPVQAVEAQIGNRAPVPLHMNRPLLQIEVVADVVRLPLHAPINVSSSSAFSAGGGQQCALCSMHNHTPVVRASVQHHVHMSRSFRLGACWKIVSLTSPYGRRY